MVIIASFGDLDLRRIGRENLQDITVGLIIALDCIIQYSMQDINLMKT